MEKQQPYSLRGAPLNKEETFVTLAATYGFTDEVTAFFLKGPMENLEDFRYYFADEEEIDTFVAAIFKPEARQAKKESHRGCSNAAL
jgi:hypothetical protein